MTTPGSGVPETGESGQKPEGSAPQQTSQQTSEPGTGDTTDWKAEAEKWKRFARQNEDRAKQNGDRANASNEELTRQGQALTLIAEKLGLDINGKPDPDKLAAELEKSKRGERQRAAELAVYRAAATAGADADALLDSRSFMASLDGLDTSSSDYRDQVTEAVKAWADANPRYQAGQQRTTQPDGEPEDKQPAKRRPPASKSGGEFGAPAPNRQWTQADVERASPQELEKAMAEGLLAENLGVGKTKPSRYRR